MVIPPLWRKRHLLCSASVRDPIRDLRLVEVPPQSVYRTNAERRAINSRQWPPYTEPPVFLDSPSEAR